MTAAQDGRIITFYSYKGGTGRTMALANTAWILAANGKRVLAVDWDLEAPGLDRFFHPFLEPNALAATYGVINIIQEYAGAATEEVPGRADDWYEAYAHVEPHAVSIRPERFDLAFPEGGALDFLSAGRQDHAFSGHVASFDWDNFYDRLGGGLFLRALRAHMKETYDYVLIDSRTGLSGNADICTLEMPDVLVDCFTLSDQALDGAAAVAHSVAESHLRRIRVLPVPMRIDEGEKEKVDAGRALARLRFDGLPKGPDGEPLGPEELAAYWGNVEIPYRPYYAYEETLATVGDESGLANSLLSSFERLTAVISDGTVRSLPPVPEPQRLRCRDAYLRRRPQAGTTDVQLVYAAENRMWADWIESLLKQNGCQVILHDVSLGPPLRADGPVRTAVLLSNAFQKSRHADAVWRALTETGPMASRGTCSPLRIDDVRLPDSYMDHNPVDLHRLNEHQCVTVLLRALDLSALPPDSRPNAPRFPGIRPKTSNVPLRNTTFTGRNLILNRIRDHLGEANGTEVRPQALFGLGGVGKTQVALEYVHRFQADYDLVWWTSAEHSDSVVASLAELAVQIGATDGDEEDMVLAGQEAVRRLSRGEPTGHWLLVFDNADDPADLLPFLPVRGGGHVLVTSRNQAWAQQKTAQRVEVFQREESVEHLTRRAKGLTTDEAVQVAEALGDLPLAVEQAAAWLAETATPVQEYLRQLDEQTANVLDLNQPVDYPKTVAATWNVSIAQLRRRSPAAARLLQLCAFLAPEPISRDLLYSRGMIEALKPYDRALQESLLLGLVIREIGRFALAKVDESGIQVHRLVQAVVRSQLTEEEQRQTRHVVHTVLVGLRPDGDEPIDDPETWPRFDIIWRHLTASDARNCTESETRRLLIDRVRYLWKRGNFPGAQKLAEELLDDWRPMLGEDDVQYLYLRGQLANVQRSQGRYVEASEVDRDLLERQARVLGAQHPHTYVTMSQLSADLAALGKYGEAVELAREAHEAFSQMFHESHPRTLSAANNRALALRMVGRYGEARDIDQDTLERRREILGEDHPYTLASAERLGRDLREVGRYAESVAQLSEAYDAHKRVMRKNFPGTLRCAKSLAVSLRRNGQFEDARRLTTSTRAEYRAQYAKPTPDSLACDLNLAADLFAADEREAARDTALEVLGEYMQVPGEAHPYTQTALNNLGIFHWGCGELDAAEETFVKVLERMAEVLGADHPHTLFASVNYANVLYDMGRHDEAEARETHALTALRRILGVHHPETLAVATNLSLTLRALDREGEARRMHDDALLELHRLLGADNGITRLAAQNRRIYRDLEPLAV
ncbi:FxSxx-COOH system tetratricopeptide repeat protein [Streptomyces mangrovisoli]|uniref:ATP/GTP-binding protein n=1 Tax=Streptomyces mangrovisoli TaxID=1428628 RepID=A0A1J4NUX4_9ACTN|nr:FxSxx-COOH system tetratricopeptide repeat protein [Streptomyces mangrovisoli]OIJ66255.1 ATP/GTP-binding protein [Streptomyces mangrovisoli]